MASVLCTTYPSKNSTLLVAALDFGTTFSGYAFSMNHEYKTEPLKIQTNHWVGGSQISLKAPTAVLLTPQRIFHSFGYEAEDKYTELAEAGSHRGWFFFRRFKMMLHNNQSLSRHTSIEDDFGKSLPALTVFAAAIRYLKEHLLGELGKRLADIVDTDVHWVLTVPAIWNESAKQFMREAGTEAGIKGDNLTLALEPEAASVFCKRIPAKELNASCSSNHSFFTAGTSYMVLDLGGGTVDITVHSVQADDTLAEVAKASGGAWGGTQVDDEFINFLKEVTGRKVLDEFRTNHTADFLDMMRDFEAKKRSISCSTGGKVSLRIPSSLRETFQVINKKPIVDHIKTTRHSGSVAFRGDKMSVNADIVKGFFTKSISNTIQHVKAIIAENEFKNINTILMVGGFAESEIVQAKIREALPGKTISTPCEAGIVVLKGAVLYGHNPKIVTSRISKYTYGVDMQIPFIPGVHPQQYRYQNLCRYVFDAFVRAGDVVQQDDVVTKRYLSDIHDVQEGFGIHASPNTLPRFVRDPSCFKLGNVFLEEPKHRVTVEMKFGGTEFSVETTDLDTGKKRFNSFDFLRH